MLEFVTELGQFALQAAIILICLIVFFAFLISALQKEKQEGQLQIKSINEKLQSLEHGLRRHTVSKKDLKALLKGQKRASKKNMWDRPTLFVLDFDGDLRASAVTHLREEITAILRVASPEDKVLLRLESPGGVVHGYGLATSQLSRIKDKGLPLITCVDKIAASGGYMMASVSDQILAAPYAIIGSIGVIASLPNFHKLLKANHIDYLEVTAGNFKRTVTPLGEITEAGLGKFKEQIESVHQLFKNHVKAKRPQLDLEKVATGEYWYGLQAHELGLVDKLTTSDDFIMEHLDTHRILTLKYVGQKGLKEKIAEGLKAQSGAFMDQLAERQWFSRFL